MKLDYGITKQQVLSLPLGLPRERGGKYVKIARDFLESGKDAVRVELDAEEKINNIQANLKTSVRRLQLPVLITRRQGDLYLLRQD